MIFASDMTAGRFVVLILAVLGACVVLGAGWLSLVMWVANSRDPRRRRPSPDPVAPPSSAAHRRSGLERVVEECPRRASAEAHELQMLQHYELPNGRLVCSFDDGVPEVRRAGGVPTMAEAARRIERDLRELR